MKVSIKKGNKKVKYDMPISWNELTLDRYMDLMKVLTDETEMHQVEKTLRIISALTKIPKRDLYALELSSIQKLGKHITDFLSTEPNTLLKHFIKIDGTEYGFHPKLVDMTMGEFVDLETYMKDINNNLHHILSVLYRPIKLKEGEKYLIEDYEPSDERAELFKNNLKVNDFNGASVFFYNLEKELSISSLKSSIKNMKKIMKETQRMEKMTT